MNKFKIQARATATLTKLQRLSLSLRDLPSETLDGVFNEFRALSRLSYISVTHASLFGPCMNGFAAHLASFSGLQTLDLSSNGIDEDGARVLAPFVAQLGSLHTLDRNYNRICGEGMLPASLLCFISFCLLYPCLSVKKSRCSFQEIFVQLVQCAKKE